MSAEIRDVVGDELAARITLLQKRTQTLAPEASARLNLAAGNLKKVTPDAAYTWIDPASFAHEVETGAGRFAETLNAIRNAAIIVPIAITWAALAWAAWGYFTDISDPRHAGDVRLPFLVLWQQGFNLHVPTLTDVGIIDCAVLTGLLVLTILSQMVERRARQTSRRLTSELNKITSDLVSISAQRRAAPTVGENASVQEVANAMQAVIDQALEESRTITQHAAMNIDQIKQSAEASIAAAQRATMDLLTDHIGPMIDTFSGRLATLQTQLADYQQRLDSLSAASQRIADGADTLGQNAGTYMAAATQMSGHIEALRGTQAQLIAQIDGVGSALNHSAGSLDQVATSIGADAVLRIRDVNENLSAATEALRQTQAGLEHAVTGLDAAAQNLATVQIVGGGLIGSLFNRRRRRRKL